MKIFISYRRDDSGFAADRIHEAALDYVDDPSHVFMDIDGIPPGVDFVDHIQQFVAECDILFALIGRDWLNIQDKETGRRRIDDPDDFVRIEIASALSRGIPVVPVLLGGAQMPSSEDLPDDLKSLARRNARQLGRQSFKGDMAELMGALGLSAHENRMESRGAKKGGNALIPSLAALAAVLVVGLVTYVFVGGAGTSPDPDIPSDTEDVIADNATSKTPRLGLRLEQNGRPVAFEAGDLDDSKLRMSASLARTGFTFVLPGNHWDGASAETPELGLAISDREDAFDFVEPRETMRDDTYFMGGCRGARYRFGSPEVWTTDFSLTLPSGSPCGSIYYLTEQYDEVSDSERSFDINFVFNLDADGVNLIETADTLYFVFYLEDGKQGANSLNSDANRIDYYEVEFLELNFTP